MTEQGDQPWLLHLSYIKPHWPYIVQAPYHQMYSAADIQPPVRSEAERRNDHPVYAGFCEHAEGVAFLRDADRNNVIPAYMGLVKQIDDHLGKLFAFMDERGLTDNTLIVFTADHGDYLGDHWLGEKEFMFEQGVRIPLIISDPSAPQTHGQVSIALAEAIDVLPTFLDTMGVPVPSHIVEGKSLRPILDGSAVKVREVAISELDYAIYGARARSDCSRAMRAWSWHTATTGSTSTTTASRPSCSTWSTTRRSSTTWAETRPTRRCARNT